MKSDSSHNQPSDGSAEPAPSPARRWTVLFIGDHGKVIAFTRVKTVIALGVAVCVLSLIAVVVLTIVNQTLHGRNREVHQNLEASRRQVEALQRERDTLTAQVVLVETRMREALSGISRSKPPAAGALERSQDKKPEPPAEAKAPAEAAGRAAEAAAGAQPAEALIAEDLRVRHVPERNTLEWQIKITSAGPVRKPVSGTIVVVVKSDALPETDWLAMPPVGLVDGRPASIQKGYAFTIGQSKVLTYSMAAPKGLRAFDTAVAYGFARNGDLLFAQEFPLRLGPSRP